MDGMTFKRMWLLLLAAVVLLAAIGAASGLSGAPSGQVSGREVDFPEEQVPAESSPFKGRIVPQRWVSLSFPSGGRVAQILVEEGQSVPAGEVLARLEGAEADASRVAAARLELLTAQQALEMLYRNAGVALAEAEYRLAQAREAHDRASWKVRRMKEPVSPLRIEQAYANLLLAERGLQKARQDLEKAERLWNNRRDPAWYVLSRREFRLNLALLSQRVAHAERKYADSVEKYNDLLEPVDEIDLQQAGAELRVAVARVEQAVRERDELFQGPSADDLAVAQARLAAAEKALQAAETALADGQLSAPFAGRVISIQGKTSQWASPGEPVLVLADASVWKVEIEEIKESEVNWLQLGQPVVLRLDALPGLELQGRVASTALFYQEKDGEVFYRAGIALSGDQPELRWGMTARVEPGAGQVTESEDDG
jgi:HlyD family secretion protein